MIHEIAQKYKNVQKGVGDMMRENEAKRNIALRMLKRGKLTIEEIAEYSGLSVAEVEQLAGLQSV